MLQKLIERRRNGNEEGFTLIELMVVVLIIAILIAIAIPTFLGARNRAQDRGAQSNIRNAFTAEKTSYTDKSQYSADVTTTLPGIEPSLHWFADEVPGAGNQTNEVSVTVTTSTGGPTSDTVVVGAKSPSGKCFYLKDVAGTGTTYGSTASASCVATNNVAGVTFTNSW
jgi:type IV pilus assembly protein PilA